MHEPIAKGELLAQLIAEQQIAFERVSADPLDEETLFVIAEVSGAGRPVVAFRDLLEVVGDGEVREIILRAFRASRNPDFRQALAYLLGEPARRESKPLLERLAELGVRVPSVASLLYRDIPEIEGVAAVLYQWLPLVRDEPLKEDLARVLSRYWPKGASVRPVIKEIRIATNSSLKRALGELIWRYAGSQDVTEIEQILQTESDPAVNALLRRGLSHKHWR